MRRVATSVALITLALLPLLVLGDVGPPVHLLVSERQPGRYHVQWRVPKVLPARAVPTPVLPESCEPVGNRDVVDQRDAWLLTQEWRCSEAIAGQPLGMLYPFRDLTLTTVIKVDLLSGDRFAHLLIAGESSWLLPEGTGAPDFIGNAKHAVVAGASHVVGSWIHLVFVLVVALFGGLRRPIELVSAFTVGQLGGALVAALSPLALGAVPGDLGLALIAGILARELLQPESEPRRLLALVAAGGVLHGLGLAATLAQSLGGSGHTLTSQLVAIVGMDAAHLVGAGGLGLLGGWLASRGAAYAGRRALAYAGGALSMALALGIALGAGTEAADAATGSVVLPQTASGGSGAATRRSRRVAAVAPNVPIQSFLTVEPFAVRHEVMVRLVGLSQHLGLDPESILEPEAQPALTERLAELVRTSAVVLIDGERPEPSQPRANFMLVDPTGSLPRSSPVPEPVAEAVVGVVVSYPADGMAETVSLGWQAYPAAISGIPATVIDPENVANIVLTPAEPTLTWENALMEDPVPAINAVPVEPLRLPLPILSLPLFALAIVLLVAGIRGKRREWSFAAARVILALGFLIGPLVETAVALPGTAGSRPSERQARRILSGVLPNIYRALEFREEALIYDRLAVTVTGETLTDVYLQQRRALEAEERGGAQARVEAVEVLEARDISSLDSGFLVRATWTVGGMVTHFGHRHFRQNRYDANIQIVPVEGSWKLQSIEVLEQERVQ